MSEQAYTAVLIERVRERVIEAAKALLEAEDITREASQHRDWDTLDFMQRGEAGRWQDLRNALAALGEQEQVKPAHPPEDPSYRFDRRGRVL